MKILTGLVQGFLGIGLDFNIPPALLYGGLRTIGHGLPSIDGPLTLYGGLFQDNLSR